MSTLNVLDALILLILGWNIIRGFNKGFVEEVFSLIGILVSIVIAYKLAPVVAVKLAGTTDTTTLALSGFFIYLIFFTVFKFLAYHFEKKTAESSLGLINSLLGFLFGVFRGIVIAAIVVFFVAIVSPDGYLIKRSSLGGLTVPVVDKAMEILDGKVEKSWRKNWEVAKTYLTKNFEEFKERLLPGGEEQKKTKG